MRGRTLTKAARQAVDKSTLGTLRPSGTYAATVLTSTDCNLTCSYCFQNEVSVPGATSRIETVRLRASTVVSIRTFLAQQMARQGVQALSLLLFGGEPLLNLAGCIRLLDECRPLGLADAQMVTNAVLLTARTATRLATTGLTGVQVSIDGGRESHDSLRLTRRGRATYDRILRNVSEAAQATDLDWHFRVNVSHRNVHTLHGLVRDLADCGVRRKSLHLALIDDVGIGFGNDLRLGKDLAKTFVDVYTMAIGLGFGATVSADGTRDCPYCARVGGAEGAVINADGSLYSCWATAGKPGWRVGDVVAGYQPTEVLAPRWVNCSHEAASHGTTREVNQFRDRVDVGILEALASRRASMQSQGRDGVSTSL